MAAGRHFGASAAWGQLMQKYLDNTIYVKQISEEEEKLSTTSLNICPEAWKGVGAGGVTPCLAPLAPPYFPANPPIFDLKTTCP
jgi:hypothetical protein